MSFELRQRNRALQRANTVRMERARLMRYMAALPASQSRAYAATLLEAACLDPCLETMLAAVFLSRIRLVGAGRARSMLSRVQVSEHRPLGMLTARQRSVLAVQLRNGGLR